jgi:hypothetical protein
VELNPGEVRCNPATPVRWSWCNPGEVELVRWSCNPGEVELVRWSCNPGEVGEVGEKAAAVRKPPRWGGGESNPGGESNTGGKASRGKASRESK